MATTPEGRVKAAVKRLLRDRGIYYYMPMSNGMGAVGAPDLICCWEGAFLAIECKAPGKRATVTPNQTRHLTDIRMAKGIALVIDDVLQLKEFLDV